MAGMSGDPSSDTLSQNETTSSGMQKYSYISSVLWQESERVEVSRLKDWDLHTDPDGGRICGGG